MACVRHLSQRVPFLTLTVTAPPSHTPLYILHLSLSFSLSLVMSSPSPHLHWVATDNSDEEREDYIPTFHDKTRSITTATVIRGLLMRIERTALPDLALLPLEYYDELHEGTTNLRDLINRAEEAMEKKEALAEESSVVVFHGEMN